MGAGQPPHPAARVEVRGRGVAGVLQPVGAGVQVDPQVDRRGEALAPALPAQVAVRLAEEVLRRHRPEQPTERPGQQQRPGAGVDALAGDVHQRDVEHRSRPAPVLLVADAQPGHHEVTRHAGAVRGAQLDLDPPAGRQRRHLGLHPQPLAQLQQDPVRAGPPDADPVPPPGLLVRHHRHHEEDEDRADGQRVPTAGRDDQAGQQHRADQQQPQLPARQREPADEHRHRQHGERPGLLGPHQRGQREHAGQPHQGRGHAGIAEPPP